MKIEQQAQTRAFLIQSFGSVRVGTYAALLSGLLCGFHFFQKAIHRKSLILCII